MMMIMVIMVIILSISVFTYGESNCSLRFLPTWWVHLLLYYLGFGDYCIHFWVSFVLSTALT